MAVAIEEYMEKYMMTHGNPHDPTHSACCQPWAVVRRRCCELQVSGQHRWMDLGISSQIVTCLLFACNYLQYIVLHLCITQIPGEYRINCISLLILFICKCISEILLVSAGAARFVCLLASCNRSSLDVYIYIYVFVFVFHQCICVFVFVYLKYCWCLLVRPDLYVC